MRHPLARLDFQLCEHMSSRKPPAVSCLFSRQKPRPSCLLYVLCALFLMIYLHSKHSDFFFFFPLSCILERSSSNEGSRHVARGHFDTWRAWGLIVLGCFIREECNFGVEISTTASLCNLHSLYCM